jgi:hypothetical protein
MAIARKPGNSPPLPSEAAAERFIAGAGTAPPPASQPGQAAAPTGGNGERRKPAMVRFDPALLARVDRAAKRRGVSRSAWIQFTLSKALDDEGAST